MIGYDFSYNGQSFSDSVFDKVNGNGIILNAVNWPDLATSDDQNNRQGEHGIETSATYIRGRVISISGEIVAQSRIKRDEFKTILQNTFSPPTFPSALNRGYNDFEFTDDDGESWIIKAKVLNMPSYQPSFGLNEFVRTPFTLQLIAEDPSIVGTTINQVNHTEGFYGGANLPFNLPVQLNNYGITSTLNNGGNWIAPLKTTITANQDSGVNMRVINTETNQFIGVQTELTAGDVLIIDTADTSITKNGFNFSGDRISGSIFHFLQPGNNNFIVRDDSQILGDGLSVDVLFEWYNTKI